jgi:hypothetical protein
MTKVRSLQILVYIIFGSLFFQGLVTGGWKAFKEGYGDVVNTSDSSFRNSEPIGIVIDGRYLTHNAAGNLKIADKYLFEDVNITANLRVNGDKVDTPYLVTGANWILTLVLFFIICKVAYNVNSVIKKVVDNSMFDWNCVKLIRNIGFLLLTYTLGDFIRQQISYYEQSLIIQAPLKVINTSEFDFGTLMMAVLVFIIAEAFKQGARLKEEQSLII